MENYSVQANYEVPSAVMMSNADDIMAGIVQHVHTEIEYYSQLLQVMEEERDILLKGRHDDLMPNCERKLTLSDKLAKVQQMRQEMMKHFNSDEFKVSKLSQLLPLLAEEQRECFRLRLIEADTLSRRLSDLNQLNRVYINEALDSIGHILSIFSGQQAGGYTAKGGRLPLSGRRILAREV